MNYDKYLDLDYLWKNKEMVHLKLNPTQRVHFYSHNLVKTTQNEEIHDHRYDFVSTILKGYFEQTIYDVRENEKGNYIQTLESCNGSKIAAPHKKVNVELFYVNSYKEGESYFMDSNTFHTVDSSHNTVTFLRRTDYKKQFANVIRPKDQSLTCPFSLKLSENEIFDCLKEILK